MKNTDKGKIVTKETSLELYTQPHAHLGAATRLAQNDLIQLARNIISSDRRQWTLRYSPGQFINALLIPLSDDKQSARAKVLSALKSCVEQFCDQSEVSQYETLLDGILTGVTQGLAVDTTDESDSGLLHYAVAAQNARLIQRLLDRQSSPLVLNKNGESPMSLAFQLKDDKVILDALLKYVGDHLINSSLHRLNPELLDKDELIGKWAGMVREVLQTVQDYSHKHQRYSNWNVLYKFFSGYMFEEERAEMLLVKLYSAISAYGNELNPAELQLVLKDCIDEAGIGIFSSYLKADLRRHEKELGKESNFKVMLMQRKDNLLDHQLKLTEERVLHLTEQMELLRENDERKGQAVRTLNDQVDELKSQIEAKVEETHQYKTHLEETMKTKLSEVNHQHQLLLQRLEAENQTLTEKLKTKSESVRPQFMPMLEGYEPPARSKERLQALESKNQVLEGQVEGLKKDVASLLQLLELSKRSTQKPKQEMKTGPVTPQQPFKFT